MAEDSPTSTADKDISKIKKSTRLEIARNVNLLLSEVGLFSSCMDTRKKKLPEEEYKLEKAYHTLMVNISNKLQNLDSLVKENEKLAIKRVQAAIKIIENRFKTLRNIPKKMMFFEKIAENLRNLADLLKGQEESDDSTESDSGDEEPSAKKVKSMVKKSL